MRSFATFALAGLVSLATAQSANTTAGTYEINPDSVDLTTRQSWCNSQTAACPLICLQTANNTADTIANSCDADDLTYSCICSNGISPNASEYSQTLPYFVCTEWGNECVANCGSSSTCAAACRDNHPCGAQNPTRINATTSSTTKTATSSAAGAKTNTAGQTIYSGFGGSAATSTAASSAKTGAATALELGQAYGMMVMVAGLFGGFALML